MLKRVYEGQLQVHLLKVEDSVSLFLITRHLLCHYFSSGFILFNRVYNPELNCLFVLVYQNFGWGLSMVEEFDQLEEELELELELKDR